MNNFFLNPGITIFGFTIYWYGIIIVCGMIIAMLLLSFLFKKFNIPSDTVYTYALAIIPVAVICARLLYIISEGGNFFDFRNGGLSIYGGLIGGAAMVFVAAKAQKHDPFKVADLVAPCVGVAQAIGRWGNFLNDEVYGKFVTNPSWQWFPVAYKSADAGGQFVMALFFYEMVWNLLGAALVLYIILKHYRKGLGIGTYFLWYGCGRLFLEGLRNEKFIMNAGAGFFSTSRITSLICILAGLAMYAYTFRHELHQLYCKLMNKPLPETAATYEPAREEIIVDVHTAGQSAQKEEVKAAKKPDEER